MEGSSRMLNPIESKRQSILREHQQVADTPKERKIVELLKDRLVSTPWAMETFSKIHDSLVNYFRNSIEHIGNVEQVHNRTQDLLNEIATTGNIKIVAGKEYLVSLPKKSPVILVTNHLGLYKLATINPKEELGLEDIGVDKMYSLPLFHASNKPVADALGDNLYIAAFEFPGEIGQIQKDAGGVVVRLDEEAKLEKSEITGIDYLISQTKKLFDKKPNSALSVLPEGRTSGKENGTSPYDLEKFRTGVFVVAAKLGIPILPVTQYFDPKSGFEVSIHKPILIPETTPREDFAKIAESTRSEMQDWLTKREAQSK